MIEMVEGISPFKGLKNKIFEVKIGEDLIKIKPTVADVEAFLLMKKEMTEEDAKAISKILVNVIHTANPEEDIGDIEAFVAHHYGDLLMQVSVVFGFTTQKQLDETKKKILQQN